MSRFAGEEFEQLVASFGFQLLRPDRRDEQPRPDSLGGFRQWSESIIETTKDHFLLERHGARTRNGLIARIAQRLLAPQPAAGTTGRPATPAATSQPMTTHSESLV